VTNESGLISGDDVLLIIEALDEYAKRGRNPAPHERKDYQDFERLSARLKMNIAMAWSEGSRWWLQGVLRRERECLTDELKNRMISLLSAPRPMTRGQLRKAFLEAIADLRDVTFRKTPVS
jgi:hypothetical protein